MRVSTLEDLNAQIGFSGLKTRSIFAPPLIDATLGNESVAAHFVPPSHTTVTPPSGLGYTAPVDRQFATTNGDYGPEIGWQQMAWKPMWNRADFIAYDKKLQHDLHIQTPHSEFESVTLFYPYFTRSPCASSGAIPDEPQPFIPSLASRSGGSALSFRL